MRERSKESKVSNKRNTDGDGYSCDKYHRPRAHAHRRAKAERKRKAKRTLMTWLQRIEDEAIDDPVPFYVRLAMEICHAPESNRLLWMKIANRGINTFAGVLSEFDVDLKNPNLRRPRHLPSAFQARLNRVLPCPSGKGSGAGNRGLGNGGGK